MVRWNLVIIAVLYMGITTVAVGIIQMIKKRGKTAESFLYADRSLSPWVGGASIALASIGSLHTTGLLEIGIDMGLMAYWMATITAASCVLEGCFFAPFWRRVKIATIPSIMDSVFSEKNKLLYSAVNIYIMFFVLALETQAGGMITSAITGIDIRISIVIFMLLCCAYMLFTGMHQAASLNSFNAVVMYVIVIIAFIIASTKLPSGWSGVEAFYLQNSPGHLSMIPKDIGTWLAFPIPMTLVCIMFQPLDQGKMQYYLAARDNRSAYKMGFISTVLNAPFGAFTLTLGLAAGSIAVFSSSGSKTAGIQLLIEYVPPLIVGLLLAVFLAIIISTWCRFTMGIAQLGVNDFYKRFSKAPKEKTELVLSRILIIGSGLLAIVPAFALPVIVLEFMFIVSAIVPIFMVLMLGIFWKRNNNAAFVTVIVGVVAAILWEKILVLQNVFGAPFWFGSVWIALILSTVLYIILALVMPGSKRSFLKDLKEKEALEGSS